MQVRTENWINNFWIPARRYKGWRVVLEFSKSEQRAMFAFSDRSVEVLEAVFCFN